MAERILVPIDQKMQLKSGWSQGFAELDVELRADNPETRTYINNKLIRGLPRLAGCMVAFTCEMPADAIPRQFKAEGIFDLSLGAEIIRLTTGRRIHNSVYFDERDSLRATAENLKRRTWIFDAEQIEEYVPPVVITPGPKPPFRLRNMFRTRQG